MNSRLSQRDEAEIQRSASEASKSRAAAIPRAELDRYRNPPADTSFALEYAFYLLGDVQGKTVLDLGCGQGENTVPLIERGSKVLAIDISPELIAITQQRLREANLQADVSVGSAYETGIPDASVDVIFCMSLIHHLDIRMVREEMRRILRPGGVVILKEPIRFSKTYAWLRNMLPAQEDISDFEHPLTREELSIMTESFQEEGTRYFRLPFVPLIARAVPATTEAAWRASGWALQKLPGLDRFATTIVTRLRKP